VLVAGARDLLGADERRCEADAQRMICESIVQRSR